MLLAKQEFGATWLHLGELRDRSYLEPAPLGKCFPVDIWKNHMARDEFPNDFESEESRPRGLSPCCGHEQSQYRHGISCPVAQSLSEQVSYWQLRMMKLCQGSFPGWPAGFSRGPQGDLVVWLRPE